MVSLVLLPVPVLLGNVRQSTLRPLRHVQNVVVPLMFQLCKVHFDVVKICVGVAVTVPALRVTFVSALSFSFISILCQYLCCMYCASSIASSWIYLDLTEFRCSFHNSSRVPVCPFVSFPATREANVPGTCAFSVVCLVTPQRLSLTLLAFACGLITWVSNTQVCTLLWASHLPCLRLCCANCSSLLTVAKNWMASKAVSARGRHSTRIYASFWETCHLPSFFWS